MLWPEGASGAISKVFYDKPFEILTPTNLQDSEGGAIVALDSVGEFLGSVRFSNFSINAQDIGLRENVAIEVHCEAGVRVESGDYLLFEGEKYRIIEILRHDSHLKIFGAKNA